MSRSGYNEDYGDEHPWELIIFRGQVASAINGKRGQAFLRELIEALDALPEKKLISDELQDATGAVCALGSVDLKRGIAMTGLDPENYDQLAEVFGIARRMIQEIEYENDDGAYYAREPETRWRHMREWAVRSLRE